MYIEDLKFSLWADFIERDYLDNEFKRLIDDGIINGATSNPAIFKNAILNSPAYKTELESLKGKSPKEKYEAVAISDITKAADILAPLYKRGDDGYVSIEVDPYLCDDAQGSIEEAKRVYSAINRANVMIKIPATPAGYIAIRELSSLGIAINATLVFTKEQALACVEALREGSALYGKKVNSVISIFVSRVDRALDSELKEHGIATGLSGIYNSAAIYSAIEAMNLEGCRALFASTGVKDDSLEAHYYIQELLAYNSVNTAPVETIEAFVLHGTVKKALPIDTLLIEEHFAKIAAVGIDMQAVLDKQIEDGLVAFKDAFRDILERL